jgi:hypothetical protein
MTNIKIPAFVPQGGTSSRQAKIKEMSKFKIQKISAFSVKLGFDSKLELYH